MNNSCFLNVSLLIATEKCRLWHPIIVYNPNNPIIGSMKQHPKRPKKHGWFGPNSEHLQPTCGANWRDLTSLAIAWFSQTVTAGWGPIQRKEVEIVTSTCRKRQPKSQWYLTFSGEFHLIAILLWRTSFEKWTSTYSIGDLSRMTHDSKPFSCTDGIWTSWTCDSHWSTKFDGSHPGLSTHPSSSMPSEPDLCLCGTPSRTVKPPPKRLLNNDLLG